MPEPETNLGRDDVSEFMRQIRDVMTCLEEVLEDEGLERLRVGRKAHPAITIFDDAATCVPRGAIPLEREPEHVAALITLFLDKVTWARPDRQASALLSIGDSASRDFVARNLREANLFEDVMAELHTWGWLRSRGLDVRLAEEEGMPDIRVAGDVPFFAEVKRIGTSANAARARKAIGDANKQLKKADPDRSGVVFIYIHRDGATLMSDDIPSDVRPFLDEIQRALQGSFFRSVACVVAIWDDSKFLGGHGRGGLRRYVARRQSRIFKHVSPRSQPSITDDDLNLAFTTLMVVEDPVREALFADQLRSHQIAVPPVDEARIAQTFRMQDRPGIRVREKHAMDALKQPDAIEAFEILGVRTVLATRRIDAGGKPFVVLIVATALPQGALEIVAAYKVRPMPAEVAPERDAPLSVFLDLIERHGVDLLYCGLVSKFMPAVIAQFDPAYATPMIGYPPGDLMAVTGGLRVEGGDPALVQLVWSYALGTDSYSRAVATRGGG